MGCFHSSGGNSSSRDRNRNTSDNPASDPRTAAQRERVRKSKQPIVATEPVDETNPQNRPEDNDAGQREQPNVADERVNQNDLQNMLEDDEIRARRFTFAELEAATENFRSRNILGEGGFGKVYKGKLADSDQIVAIKRMNTEGEQGDEEFLNEVLTLSRCDHPNLVKLIGFCAEGDERLLVYEYMRLGSLDNHLYGELPSRRVLDWNARMQIAVGVACGLEYLHNQLNPPIIYRDLKTSNILLDGEFNAKLSDFGMAKVGPVGDKSHITTRIMGTYGYCAPEYAMTGHITQKSDIFSFGVVMLELITGRKAIDEKKTGADKNLVSWARPLLTDSRNFADMVDRALKEQFPGRELYQAVSIAAMCIEYQPIGRPLAVDLLNAANYVASKKYDPKIHRRPQRGSDGAGPSGVKKDDQDEG